MPNESKRTLSNTHERRLRQFPLFATAAQFLPGTGLLRVLLSLHINSLTLFAGRQ